MQTFGVDFDAMHFWFDRSSRIKARTAQTMADMYLSLDYEQKDDFPSYDSFAKAMES